MSKKKLTILALVLVVVLAALLCVLLCANCAAQKEPDPTAPVTTNPSEPTTEPTETTVPPTTHVPVTKPSMPPAVPTYINPFTGKAQDEEFASRPFLISINNNKNAMPLCGLNQADVVFEMLTNARSTRFLALVTDVNAIERIGAIRSLRYNFIDIAQAYDGIVVYASASKQVLADLQASWVDHINALSNGNGGAFYREQGRLDSGYAREHTLFTIPSLMAQYAGKLGYEADALTKADYGFRFADDGTFDGGETANTITMSFFTGNKQTIMKYDATTQRYQLNQYGADQLDGNTNEPLTFKNVFTLFAVNVDEGVYHVAQLQGSGEGYYASNGKIVPIKWYHEAEEDPFTFTLADGTPLEQSVGNSYVGIIPTGSAFTYE